MTNRSYRLRGVRITPSQQAARDNLWAKYGVASADSQIDLDSLFSKKQPIVMEIGYGMGEATWQIAKANPDIKLLRCRSAHAWCWKANGEVGRTRSSQMCD
jgi:tRNA (guanine-N7-)-methyltransferase